MPADLRAACISGQIWSWRRLYSTGSAPGNSLMMNAMRCTRSPFVGSELGALFSEDHRHVDRDIGREQGRGGVATPEQRRRAVAATRRQRIAVDLDPVGVQVDDPVLG